MNEIKIERQSEHAFPPQEAVLNLDDIFSFDSHKKQTNPTSAPRNNESQNLTREALQNILTTRRKQRVPSRDSKATKYSQEVLESARTTNPRSTPRMNVYLNNYDYYEQRINQNNLHSTPHQLQSPRTKELNDSIASNLVQRNLSGFEDASALEFDLQAEIDRLEPFDKIKLPSTVIKIEKLHIEKPVTIIGTSNSRIEISNSIHVNLSKFPKKNKRVLFCECTIYFEYQNKKNISSQLLSTKRFERSGIYRYDDRKSYSDTINMSQSNFQKGQMTTEIHKMGSNNYSEGKDYPLFIIYSNSGLEMTDCNITSKNSDINNNDVCFYLKKSIEEQLEEIETQPSLYIQSSLIQDFTKVVQNNTMGNISLEKMYISNTKGHAIDILNPCFLEVKECIFEKSTKSCINLRFSKEKSTQNSIERSVLVERCEFLKGKGYGISIFGESLTFQNCIINIIGNKIFSFAKDGIGIKNLNIKEILIEKNEIVETQRSGIFLTNILDTLNFSQVKLTGNKITDSHLYGLAILSAGCYTENNEISQNSKGGILLSSGDRAIEGEDIEFYKKYPLRNIFNADNVSQNRDSGVIIMGVLKGPLIFNGCRVFGNTNGFYIRQVIESPSNNKLTNDNKEICIKNETIGDIVLDKCNIYENLVNGVHIKSILNQIYLKGTMIYSNKNYAAFLQREEDKEKLVFKGEGKKNKVKHYIFGYVGGPWGLLYEQSYGNACKGAKCSIF